MDKVIKAGILGGIVLFIWSAISWMILPWHENTLNKFKVEPAIVQAITANITGPGIYFSPQVKESAGQAKDTVASDTQANTAEPMIFAAVSTIGKTNAMARAMGISFITQVLSAMFVAWLLLQAKGLSFIGRVGFVIVFALAASLITHIPYWNWFGFDTHYTFVEISDLLVSWFLAGLVLAFICKQKGY